MKFIETTLIISKCFKISHSLGFSAASISKIKTFPPKIKNGFIESVFMIAIDRMNNNEKADLFC